MSNTLAVVPETSVKIGIQTSDVVAIGVSKIEDEIRARIKDAEAELRACKAELVECQKALKKAVEKEGRRKYAKYLKAYQVLCGAFPDGYYSSRRDRDAKLVINVCEGDPGVYTASIGDSFSANNIKAEGVQDLIDAVEKAMKAQKTALEALCSIRSKLTDLPAYERKIRATLATKTLEGTAEGRAFLKTIESGVGNIERLLGSGN